MRIQPLQTPRMTLRSIQSEDRDEYVRVHEVSADFYSNWIPARVPDVTWGDWFDKELGKASKDNHLRLVGVIPSGRIAGFFNLGEIVRGFFQSGYAGWRTNVEFSRQGYAVEGVTALLDLAFSSHGGLGLHRVQANVIPENLPSIRLAERVGFRKEGLALRYLKIAGEWQDHIMFAKLAEEHVPKYLSPDRALDQECGGA